MAGVVCGVRGTGFQPVIINHGQDAHATNHSQDVGALIVGTRRAVPLHSGGSETRPYNRTTSGARPCNRQTGMSIVPNRTFLFVLIILNPVVYWNKTTADIKQLPMKINKQPYTALLIIWLLSTISHGCAAPVAFEDDPRFTKLISSDATARAGMVGSLLAGSEDERQLVTDFLERAEDTKYDINRVALAAVLLGGSQTPTEEYLGLVHATTLDNNLWPMFRLVDNWMDVPGVKLINNGLGSAYDKEGKLLKYNALILQPWQRASSRPPHILPQN
jgi:hypothetical protein